MTVKLQIFPYSCVLQQHNYFVYCFTHIILSMLQFKQSRCLQKSWPSASVSLPNWVLIKVWQSNIRTLILYIQVLIPYQLKKCSWALINFSLFLIGPWEWFDLVFHWLALPESSARRGFLTQITLQWETLNRIFQIETAFPSFLWHSPRCLRDGWVYTLTSVTKSYCLEVRLEDKKDETNFRNGQHLTMQS